MENTSVTTLRRGIYPLRGNMLRACFAARAARRARWGVNFDARHRRFDFEAPTTWPRAHAAIGSPSTGWDREWRSERSGLGKPAAVLPAYCRLAVRSDGSAYLDRSTAAQSVQHSRRSLQIWEGVEPVRRASATSRRNAASLASTSRTSGI